MIIDMKNKTQKLQKGFTLIELLIVIAVIGVLASVVLVAIDPLEQLARGRDSGRKNTISQLGNALAAYQTANSQNTLPGSNAGWATSLTNAGEIKLIPGVNSISGTSCVSNKVNSTWCYNTAVISGTTYAAVYTPLESNAENSKCTATPNTVAYFLWSSGMGQAGVACGPVGDMGAVTASYTFK